MADTATKIRIFSLAKELGMDSKVLIEHCRAAGLTVKGSALASISPEEKELVLSQMGGAVTSDSDVTAEAVEIPAREFAQRDLGARMRDIRTMAPRDRASDRLTSPGKPQLASDEDATPVATNQQVSAQAVSDTDNAVKGRTEVVARRAESDTVSDSETVTDSTSVDSGSDLTSMRREDYMPQHGGGRTPVREMRPRGTPTHSELSDAQEAETAAEKESDRSRPGLAPLPAFKVQEKKSAVAEPKAQKPEIRLTPDQLDGQSPLGVRLKSAAETKTPRGARKKSVEFTDENSEDKAKVGTLDATRRARRQGRHRPQMDDDGDVRRNARKPRKRRGGPNPADLKTSATMGDAITVRSLSEAIGRPAKQILTAMFKRGHMVTINQGLDEEIAWEIAAELGVDLEVKRSQTSAEYLNEVYDVEDSEESLAERPPVVTILGHVDHGKTSLLDKIRATDVAGGEAGGITQHIRAYQINHEGKKITFVDTPGHAAFGEMRARGANVTDIIVLVVAANDSVMPQTVECISHAKASGVPVIVALNKCDLPDINEQRVLTDLSTNGIQPQEWGGDIEVVRTSAMTGQGVDDLLETILLTAEIGELKANPDRNSIGVCLEAFRDEGVGPIAWLIVQRGTLRIGDAIVCGEAFGRIRGLYNDRGEMVEEVGPSSPVKLTGLDLVPGAGDRFFVLDDLDRARSVAEENRQVGREAMLSNRNRPRTLDDVLDAAREGLVQDLNVIIKADTQGSIEALRGEIQKFEHPEVRVKILHEAVGGVNDSDIYLASASDAIVIAFHVIAEDRARQLAEREGVEIRRYEIIYEIIDQIKRTLEGLLLPEKVQVATGRALVLQTFSVSKFGTIAGCRVLNGTIERSNRVHVIRDQKVLNDYSIASLKRVKDDAKEVREGMECGIRLDGFNDVKEGDLLEAFRIDTVKRTLE
ncbi:MAG: translation initiation factor IF-2 [Planctomycetota bacterium]|nr:translation initiation factor IF-2 [Planctomycetota bacterium]